MSSLAKVFQTGAGTVPVLRQVDLEVGRGEMAAIMGPSGSGKSTLLFILGLFLSPSSGMYLFDGEDVSKFGRSAQAEFRRRRIGFVFQSADLLENSTVYENLEFPLIYARVRRRERKPRIHAALERVKLSHRMRHPSNLLSGGERQRVAIARALVNRPQLILADEPTGQLDSDNSELIMQYLEQVVAEAGVTLVVVSHDPAVASRCGKVFRLNDGVLSGGQP